MKVIVKEAEQALMANFQLTKANSETPNAKTPTVDTSQVSRKNMQLQAMVHDLQQKLKDVRGKLEEEVQMRKKIESGVETEDVDS